MSNNTFRYANVRISSCDGCVPPERNPYCHATCPKYKQAREKADAESAAISKEKKLQSELTSQQFEQIDKAMKSRRK